MSALLAEGHRFHFYQAVSWVQRMFPEAARVGTSGSAEQECLRFAVDPDLSFPTADVLRVERLDREPQRFRMTGSFFGLHGASSPLPSFYGEEVLHQLPDETLTRDFLDLFHHRLISLLYRAWEKYRFAVRFRSDGKDQLSGLFLGLLGFPETRHVAPLRLLAWTGLFCQQPHSAAALRGILADLFPEVSVDLDPCIGRWVPIDPEQQSQLGRRNSTLGADLSVGGRIFDRSGTYRIALGPLTLEQFTSFLPGGRQRAALCEVVGIFAPDALDYETDLRIRRAEIPSLHLSGQHARLGWSTWLGERPAQDEHVTFFVRSGSHGER